MYTRNVSAEPLDVIFANECRDEPVLASKRFRRLQNEIERLQSELQKIEARDTYTDKAEASHQDYIDSQRKDT